jgi:L-cysteine:1D-myo-inositol 2-amino-2-deoxy-alpha-D-glucopyranoside ligase
VEPAAIRLLLLAHHYRTDWEYTEADLATALERLGRWRAAVSMNGGPAAEPTVQHLREALGDDLRTPDALAAVDRWAHQQLTRGGSDVGAPGVLARALDALLGVRL